MQKYVFIVSLIIVLFSCVQGYISSSISNVNAKKKKIWNLVWFISVY